MHCLLCHEKISRVRYWRTKSEFCCDEHAAAHRRQTLERLMGWSAAGGDDPGAEAALEADAEEWDALPSPVGGVEMAHSSDAEDLAANGGYAANEWLITDDEAAYDGRPESESHAAREDARLTPPAEPKGADTDDEDVYFFETSSVQRDEPFPIEIFTSETDEEEERAAAAARSGPIEPTESEDSELGPHEWGELLPNKTSSAPPTLPRAPEVDRFPASGFTDDPPETGEAPFMAARRREIDPAAFDRAGERDDPSEGMPASEPLEEVVAWEAARIGSESPVQSEGSLEEDESADRFLPLPAARKGSDREPEDAKAASGPAPLQAREGTEGLNQFAETLREHVSGPRLAGAESDAGRDGQRKPVLVCFLPVQGGSGASTVSLHVAEAISRNTPERVLVADFDFHCGTLAFRLGLRPTHTLSDVLEWKKEKHLIWETAVCHWKKLDVLVAPTTNSPIRPQSLDAMPEIFSSALRRYPYVIIDHPDAIYSSSRHILTLANLVYLVCTPEMTALHLARRKVQQIRALGVPNDRLRLVVNRASSWGSLGVKDIGRIVGVPVSWALDNDYAALRDAVWNGGLVEEDSTLAAQLRGLGRSVMGLDALVEDKAPVAVNAPPV